jgi:galactokinase
MIQQFRELYGAGPQPRIFRAPGRVNLIGEHTDYNLGFVMPIALDMACYVAAAPAHDHKIHVYSLDRGEGFTLDPDVRAAKPRHDWTDYVVGVAHQLASNGVSIAPLQLMVHSQVPEGSGLSSSAALEVSSALAFLGGRTYGKIDLAKLCQRAEIDFVGMPCGIMDQYISLFGQQGYAVEIDCRSLEHRLVELPGDVSIVAVNSMVKHELASSAYRERVRECNAAVEAIRKVDPKVESLRDANLKLLETAALGEIEKKRARHVITEDERVQEFRAAAASRDLAAMGRLFVASHRSMQHDYEVSCEEIDFLVDSALAIEGVYGARMTGGGFGGCTVNLVKPEALESFRNQIVGVYKQKYGVDVPVFRCLPSKGASEVTDFSGLPVAPATK